MDDDALICVVDFDSGRVVYIPGVSLSVEHLSCAECMFFVEATEASDQVRWGFCRRFPPIPVATVADDGSDTVSSVGAWVELPYACGEFRPRMQ